MADDQAAAQAAELVRALCDQLHAMTRQLARLERQGVNGTKCAASAAVRYEAAALRRDIHEAQFLIDRLERRYLNGNGRVQPRLQEQPRRLVARSQQGTRSPWSASEQLIGRSLLSSGAAQFIVKTVSQAVRAARWSLMA